ncbi:uncharacterized protein A4U43_C04F11470 [Asparagus officinalis]|uniref:Uncharacterized protein n=1 Tax=Asparagus officinalis TaxID=4686 RepID=A0A5P1F4W6_ASPOF|nr:uncharacterized protein A4U43_C04F11470 [Asparagus officinalis]
MGSKTRRRHPNEYRQSLPRSEQRALRPEAWGGRSRRWRGRRWAEGRCRSRWPRTWTAARMGRRRKERSTVYSLPSVRAFGSSPSQRDARRPTARGLAGRATRGALLDATLKENPGRLRGEGAGAERWGGFGTGVSVCG